LSRGAARIVRSGPASALLDIFQAERVSSQSVGRIFSPNYVISEYLYRFLEDAVVIGSGMLTRVTCGATLAFR